MIDSILIKLSGEMLGDNTPPINHQIFDKIAKQLIELNKNGTKIGVVVGAGNIIRGSTAKHIDTVAADYIGMLSTNINALVLAEHIKNNNYNSIIMGYGGNNMVEQYSINKSRKYINDGIITIFGGGINNAAFTTDTACVIKAYENNINTVFKMTKYDGIYDKDPQQHNDAQFITNITFDDILNKKIMVMDITAMCIAKEKNINIIIGNMKNNMIDIIQGKSKRSVVSNQYYV